MIKGTLENIPKMMLTENFTNIGIKMLFVFAKNVDTKLRNMNSSYCLFKLNPIPQEIFFLWILLGES
jgi:hypothetical protein